MRLSITTEAGELHSLSLPPSLDLASLRALVAAELSAANASSVVLLHNGAVLDGDARTLLELGVVEDDILLVRIGPTRPAAVADTAELARLQLLADAGALERLARAQPAVADAALNNPTEFRRMFRELERARREAEERRATELARLDNADPFDMEAQRKIEEMIRQEQVQENMELAMEHNPEAFGRVTMLYIDCQVNGHSVKAFVDSGAQATIMSPECAEACGIMRLLDSRFAGIARGVGTAKILGRVHSAPMKVGDKYFSCSFTVMEGKGVDLLFGLDMLRRHQAVIDLGENCLRMYDQAVPFLSEHELPEKARWEGADEADPAAEGAVTPGSLAAAGGPTPAAATAAASPAVQAPQQPQPSITLPVPASRIAPSRGSVNEEHVSTLMALGASREEAIRALEAAGGNVDLAASLMF